MLKTAVIGSGGAGRNMLYALINSGMPLYLINSIKDPRFREISSSRVEIQASVSTNPSVKRDMLTTESSAFSVIQSYDLVFSVSGFGGFYGTAVPIMLTRLSKKVIPIFTMPFSIEGEKRRENSIKGLKEIMKSCRWFIALENDKLLKIAPNATLEGAFRAMNLLLSSVIVEITHAFKKESEILGALHGRVGVGIGRGEGMNRQEKALMSALSSPWLDITGKTVVIMKGGTPDDFIWIKEKIADMGADISAESHRAGDGIIELIILS